MTALRARIDCILVVEVDGQAVQHEFHTTLRDQLELTKRFPKEAQDTMEGPLRLVYIAAQRCGVPGSSGSFDEFIDVVLDVQVEQPPPLVKG